MFVSSKSDEQKTLMFRIETKVFGGKGMLLHCVRIACTCRKTYPRSPATSLLARQSSKAHKITTKPPSNWYSDVPMNKPLSHVRYIYVVACKMHTCSSGK